MYAWKPLDDDPAEPDEDVKRFLEDYYEELYGDNRFDFREQELNAVFEWWVGRKIGEKWAAEIGGEYDQWYQGIRDIQFLLTRDLHNALAQLRFRYKRDPWDEDQDYDYDIRFALQFKLPGPMDAAVAPRARVLMEEQRMLMLAEGDPLVF